MTPADFRRLFHAERARFAQFYPHVGGANVALLDAPCPPHKPDCARRDVAWCFPATGAVVFLRRALALPRANLVALVRHELAHVACPACSEAQADALAGIVGGVPIRYDRRDLQTISPRGRLGRPAHLHQ